MRRSQLLTIQVLCPHFERPVEAKRNEATGRLVDCAAKTECVSAGDGATIVVYPQGCPVFRTAG